MEAATRLVILQPEGLNEIPAALRSKVRVIYQSVRMPKATTKCPPRRSIAGSAGAHEFRVCVLGHLRMEKDPFRTAEAARRLPEESRIRVVHVGAALTEGMAERARYEERTHPRYRWLGEMPRWRALRILSGSHLLSLTSVMEGGANAISEAIAASVPVVASRISGTVGILGEDYPGYFPVGATDSLADLLLRAELDPAFYARLKDHCESRAWLTDPESERESWRALLAEM